ncbi:hypothetical protein BK120_16290 [Paenibacillus sp. FSL A5-0031]|uniref:hypothetical protein n=1 Tax=Paenibacillus sp. FSL A5-0031 TaxID=1920420 RepID=UPI00096C1E7C|nr:hypothetical protein [Paenibacillus sp. FSL A5-0031]OME82217.1 hypothetical protein BK120_16290 [Paenibacillus sp. FSL A5-0031]
MKKFYILFLSICIAVTCIIPMASAAEAKTEAPPTVNERVVNILKENNIDFQIVDGNIKLNQTSTEVITAVNNLLSSQSQLNRGSIAATAYPTPYTHMPLYNITKSKKFTAATKTAFGAAFTAWAKNIFSPWQEIAGVAVGGFAVYYFVNSETEDLYTFIKYYYRELGAGFFDMNGTFIGDYQIKKEIRVTKNSNGTGGSTGTDERASSIIEPWF